MLQHLAGAALAFALCLVAIVGLRAPRARSFAVLGLVPAAGACVAFTSAAFDPEPRALSAYAHGLAALALGFAHAVVCSLVALPRERVWMRGPFVFAGLVAGALATLWIAHPSPSAWLGAALAPFALATLAAWIALPFLSRERGVTRHGALVVPSVRFACPRCGTRVDWGKGVAACTDCGLFLHIAWPAEEPHAAAAVPDERDVRFACPECGSRGRWSTGLSTCGRCGLRLSLHWNVHRAQR